MIDENKKNFLLLKNRRRNFLRSFPILNDEKSLAFLEPKFSQELLLEIYKKVDLMKGIVLDLDKENTVKEMLDHKLNISRFVNLEGVFFHRYSNEIGALVIPMKCFIENMESILRYLIVEENDHLILVGRDLSFGIFLFRHEYERELHIWP